MTPRADVSLASSEIDAFLNEPRTAVLSTLGPTGAPHMAAMWFVVKDDAIEMWTYAKSQKAVNARRDPRVAVLIEEGIAYNELRGVLVKGIAEVIEDLAAVVDIGRRLYECYTLPRTQVPVEAAMPEIERQGRKRIGIRLAMRDVASWDHSKL
ncbi:MAG: TIGR03618 family F420-dependent PPOX class oxidoreductase [Actinomycetota bacterium]